jgi:Short C-terminal domain
MRRTHALTLVIASLSLAGCSITQTVDPIKGTQASQVCVANNPKVHMDEFQPEVQRQIEARGIPTRAYSGTRPAECSLHLEYTANWAWDMAMYLTYAEFRVYDGAGLAGQAVYDARNGGARLDKFGTTAEKIRPLIEQLFGAVSAGQVLVPASGASVAASGPTRDRSDRLTELQQLRERGIISEEEFSAKRREILGEI